MLRDVFITAAIVGSLPMCFLRPWVGVLVWSWVGYMNPHRLTWGFATTMPFAYMVAVPTLTGLIFTKERRPLPRTGEVYLLLALWGTFLLSTVFADYPTEAWDQLDKVSKIFLLTLVTLMLFQEERKLRALLWIIALSIGFFGFKGGIWGLATGGGSNLSGPPGTFIGGNNQLALALNMVLSIFVFLRREEKRAWRRHLLVAAFCLSVVSVVSTFSRGGFLGLAVTLMTLTLMSRKKTLGLACLVAVIVAAPIVISGKWFDRMETITNYEQDGSAMGRIDAWYVAYRLALDNPLLGAGFRPFTLETFGRYLPGYPRSLDAHSIFFQLLGEHGFTGLALFVALIGSTLVSAFRLSQRTRHDPGLRWVYNCSQAMIVGVLAYVASGLFLSLSYFDLFYHFVAIVVLLKHCVRQYEGKAVTVSALLPTGRRP